MPDDLKQQIRGDSYVTAEARARVEIDRQLEEAEWAAHDADKVSPATARGVAIREFVEPRRRQRRTARHADIGHDARLLIDVERTRHVLALTYVAGNGTRWKPSSPCSISQTCQTDVRDNMKMIPMEAATRHVIPSARRPRWKIGR